MADAGWFADPSGRFGQRYYDGSTWSQHVVGANGSVIEDELPERETPFPPPSATPPAAAPTPPEPAQMLSGQMLSGQTPSGQMPQFASAPGFGPATPPAVRYGVGAGLYIGLVGIVLVALSLFAVKWADADKSKFTDLSSALRKADVSHFPSAGVHAYYIYATWLAFVLFAAVLVLVVLAGIPVPHTGVGNRVWRIAASVLAGVGAVLHSMMVAYLFKGSGHAPGGGAVLGIAGWLVVMIATIFGARRIVRPPARPF